MTTIINNPADTDEMGFGVIFAIFAAIIVVITLFFGYALPALQAGQAKNSETADVNITAPLAVPN